jgi:hypothetical protein
MGDLIFVAVVVVFFAVTAAYVRGCERIVGPAEAGPVEADSGGHGGEAPAAGAPGAAERRRDVWA